MGSFTVCPKVDGRCVTVLQGGNKRYMVLLANVLSAGLF